MDPVLPPRLGALLALEPDTAFAERLRRVHEAAARAISKLGDLDLVKYEDSPIDGSADLSLWEEVAPVVGSTIADVNALLAEVSINFPHGELITDQRQGELDQLIQQAAAELQQEVANFGRRVRDPSVVGDRWNLIAELQTFRFQFRNRIGAMVFETASRLGDCRRQDVEPGYPEALKSTLLVRATTSDLRRLMHNRIQKVSEVPADEVAAQCQQVEKELNAFGRTPAWTALRAQDKKVILEFRATLRGVMRPTVSKVELLQVLEPFVEFVDTFGQINDRDMLVEHDREALAGLGVALERGTNAGSGTDALAAYHEAIKIAQALYGRSAEFDALLRKARKTEHNEATARDDLEQLLGSLGNLSLY